MIDDLNHLPDDCLVVLHMIYVEGYKGREVARRLYLSASRISQIKKKALSLMRARSEG